MMSRIACVVLLALGAALACEEREGGKDGEINTADECEDAGGEVRASPGGPIECEAGEEEIGQIPAGIEGAICCRPVQD